ncbi:hypothetical protein PIB30_034770 [Stylosanthes scabra]|uniref:Uncharacterized protein n=1 Tax=Stylosanthes scabra TaxID=79078 RepID=A0ABU6QCC7_9FABA|nr:hypothetical protein [Stylosanthes scabra]
MKNGENKKKRKNRALAQLHDLKNAKFLALGAVAPPRPSNGAPARLARPAMALARPRGELGHIRPQATKLHGALAPPLGAPARPVHPRDGLGASAPSP